MVASKSYESRASSAGLVLQKQVSGENDVVVGVGFRRHGRPESQLAAETGQRLAEFSLEDHD